MAAALLLWLAVSADTLSDLVDTERATHIHFYFRIPDSKVIVSVHPTATTYMWGPYTACVDKGAEQQWSTTKSVNQNGYIWQHNVGQLMPPQFSSLPHIELGPSKRLRVAYTEVEGPVRVEYVAPYHSGAE